MAIVYELDQEPWNADWSKRTWDFDDINDVEALRAWLKAEGTSVEDFKQLPVYQFNIDKLPWLKDL